MVKVVVVEKEPSIFLVVGILGVIITIVMTIVILSILGSRLWFMFCIVFIVESLALIFFITYYHKTKKINLMLRQLHSMIRVSGNKIVFPQSLSVEKGYLESIGYWIYTGNTRSYYHKNSFKPLANANVREINLGRVDENYVVLMNVDESGYFKIPCVKIVEPEYRDTYILFLKPCRKTMRETTISVASGDDVAEARISIENGLLKGYLKRIFIGKARSARLELWGEVKPESRKIWVRRVLGEVKEGETMVNERICPSEPIIVIAHEKTLSPRTLCKVFEKQLGVTRPIILGLGIVEYKARLVLDLPFRRDVYKEVVLKTS